MPQKKHGGNVLPRLRGRPLKTRGLGPDGLQKFGGQKFCTTPVSLQEEGEDDRCGNKVQAERKASEKNRREKT